MQFTKPLLLVALAKLGIAGYALQDAYLPDSFFSGFNFFSVSPGQFVAIITVFGTHTLTRL